MYCILIKLLIYVYKALSKSFMVPNMKSLTHQHHSYREFQQQQNNNNNKNSKQCLILQLQSEKPYLYIWFCLLTLGPYARRANSPTNCFYILRSDDTEKIGICEFQIGLSDWPKHCHSLTVLHLSSLNTV